MAGGKQTPRQKMVNLMYLVFIAMMALNMSKEVLSAFGLLNEKFESSNKDASTNNDGLYSALATKASDDKAQYGAAKELADKAKATSATFFNYIGTLKADVVKGVELKDGKLPYEAMDKGEKIDEAWFAGDGYSPKGKEVLATIENYKKEMTAILAGNPKYVGLIKEINNKFNTADVKDGEGVTKKFLDYHYKGFPSIASLTKLSAMQNDVKTIEASVYNIALGKAAEDAASYSKFNAIVVLDKTAFFSGEAVTGKVVLGRYDESTVPTSVSVTGGSVNMENGQAKFKLGAGSVGEHDIKGQFVFTENNKPVNIDIKGSYVVVPKPNSATISADKMNSVYRGVTNPMTISFAGVSDNNVTASGPGLTKGSRPGQYNWTVTSVPGETATVTVSATLADGTKVSDKKNFVIRDIPRPAPSIRGKVFNHKGSKEDLLVSTINAEFPDFVFDVNVTVNSFEISVPGSPRILVQGNKFDGAARAAIQKAKRGDVVSIGNVKVSVSGAAGYRVKDSGNFAWEIQ